MTKVVELALETYAREHGVGQRSWSDFVDELRSMPRDPDEPDIDLDALIREDRKPHQGIDLE